MVKKTPRPWKDERTPFGAVFHQTQASAVHPSYSKRRAAEAQLRAVRDMAKDMKAQKHAEKEAARARAQAKREAKEAKEKAQLAQSGVVVKNLYHKMKRMNKRQIAQLHTV
jgi:regulator of protease activity HflC (stomatin/prohibitin superfamily)